ncbi:MAG: aminotransferase class III-fold pyridoxal phosphate-dependent enzyme, partial [Hyphomonadaceae bacterium]
MGAGGDHKGKGELPANAIAVIGMAGRFPGADTVEALWAAFREGRDLISRFSDEELEDSFTAEERAQPNFVKARPILKDVEKFDAQFFGMYPREAALLDPQHRLMLEVAYEAFEDAGVDPFAYDGAIGVFASNTLNTYLIQHVLGDRETAENFTSTAQLGDYARFAGAMGDTMATRVSYKLNLRGPAMSVQSCCSSSLLAVAQACQSLILYQSDMAIAGGVSITFPQKRGYHYLDGGMASKDGYCRPFDAEAAGTMFGHGAGAVLLKRLEDAVADGDRIYAVIRSSAVNNDGADKVGYTAPSVDGQAAVIMTAHMTAGIDPRSIGYIEAHGTATPMGDPIEIAGLTKAFEAGTSDRQFCAIGSGKANLGHLDAAAGVVGFIKAALSLHHNEIPPLAHFKAPNPRIDFTQTPFFVADTLQAFPPTNGPRRAGVSSFGVGGTNVHVLLEEAPQTSSNDVRDAPRTELLTVSAKTDASVNAMKAALADHLEANPLLDLGDVAFTLQTARHAFEKRTAIAARTREEAIARLRAASPFSKAADAAPPIVFMFPGQGVQYPGMGADLYRREPLFKSIIDRGAEVLKPLLELDIRDPLYNQPDAGEDTHHPIRSTILAQPALFLTEYAIARLLLSWGVKPTAMVGHSVGEFVAACLAGVMKFEDALALIAARGRLMQAQEAGAMLSIRLPEAEARPLLGEDVDLAAINGPGLVVAAGPFAAIEALEIRLSEKGVQHRRLHTSHAFHSRMMDAALAPLMTEAEKISFAAPKVPYASGLTGAWATEDEACDPRAWARHCRETVRFADALATACEGRKPILIEVGAGKTLSMLAAQIVAKDKLAGIVNTLPDVSREPVESVVATEAVGRVWALGGATALDALRSPNARRVDLPKYRWDKQRHFIDAPARKPAAAQAAEAMPPSAEALFQFPQLQIAAAQIAPAPEPVSLEQNVPMSVQMTPEAHQAALASDLVRILEDLSGEAIAGEDPNTSFLELGFDSLFLGQVAQAIQSKFGVKLTFRQLLGDFPSVEAVSAHLATQVPFPAATAPAPQAPAAQTMQTPPVAMQPMMAMAMPQASGDMANLFQMQLMAMQGLFAQQLAMMQGGQAPVMQQPQAAATPALAPPAAAAIETKSAAPAAKAEAEEDTTPQRFKMYRPGASQPRSELTNAQRALVEDLVALLEKRMPTSKRLTQENREPLADPRTAAGFRAEWKELVFPIVSERSKGSRIWDIDGNEYVDVVNGYGGVAFGHAPDFVVAAVEEQLHKGFAIGPQSPMAGEVAHMLTKMLGMDRVTFCNTGSEAVMAAMRLTRAVSGKKKVVVFNNDYHGQFDEVLLRPAPKTKPPGAFPVAPGITQENVANMVVLTYGDAASLDWIKANAGELAAVMIEPVQSRHPEIQPVEFVRELRKIT